METEMIFYSTRLEMENTFRDWCNKNNAAISLNSMLAWLEGCGYLNEDKIRKDFPYPGIKIKEETSK
jgi:hypothetical protein